MWFMGRSLEDHLSNHVGAHEACLIWDMTADIVLGLVDLAMIHHMLALMPAKFEVRDVLRTLEEAGLENKLPIYDDGRMIVEEAHMALKDDMMFATRNYRAPYGLEELELRQEGKKLNAAGPLYVSFLEYKTSDPTTPLPLSVGTPGDRRNLP